MSLDTQHYHTPIKEITTWVTRWNILGRVTNKGPVNSFKRQGGIPGKVFSLDIMDKAGDSIRAKFWGNAVDKWHPLLQESKVYTFSAGRVQLANKRFNNLNHAYEIIFDVDAKIAEVNQSENTSTTANSIPYIRKYNFVSLRDIGNSPRELPFLVDLLVVVKWISPSVDQFVNRTTQDMGIRRLAHVVDDTGYQMTLTLFGDNTECHNEEHQEDQLKSGVILALQNVQIREFRGRNGSTLRSTNIVVDPDIPEAQPLRTWLESIVLERESFKMLSESSSAGDFSLTSSSSNRGADKPMLLKEVAAALDQLEVSTSATPSDSNSEVYIVSPVEIIKLLYVNRSNEATIVYTSCPKCNRKVMPSPTTTGYRCEVCLLNLDKPSHRFMFAVHLADSSGARFTARVFHDAAAAILNTNVEYIAKLVPPKLNSSDIPVEAREILEYDALWKKYRAGVRGRRDYFGGEERTNISLVFLEPYNYTLGAKQLLGTILATLDSKDTQKRSSSLGDPYMEFNNSAKKFKSSLSS